jgi:hypothetical protein
MREIAMSSIRTAMSLAAQQRGGIRMRKQIIGLMAAAAFGFVGIADGLAISNQQDGDGPVSGDGPVPGDKPEQEKPKPYDQCSIAFKGCLDRCGRVFEGDRIDACKRRCDNVFIACEPSGQVPRAH